MNALERVRARYQQGGSVAPADAEKSESRTCKTCKSPSAGSAGSENTQNPAEAAYIELAGERLAAAREERRRAILEKLSAAPQGVRYALLTDDHAHTDYIVLSLAVRDIGTCELSIPRECYNPVRLLEIVSLFGVRGADGER
jgi:hypothetical protein